LASFVQKKEESLREFIQCFYNKRNIILEVNDKSIIMFFKKGLRDSSLICMLTKKNPRTSEEILEIANKYALAEEATLDTRDQKEDKEQGHSTQPNTLKNNDTKRTSDWSVANIERPHRNKEYRPQTRAFEGFVDQICILHPKENTGLRTAIDCKALQMRFPGPDLYSPPRGKHRT
jgi:hypothetical protein